MDAQLTDYDVTEVQLTVEGFPIFYHGVLGLRFPLDVSQVLELRFLINNAVDRYKIPATTAEDRQVHEALRAAVASFGIDNTHHRERLTKILTMIRGLHAGHLVESRVAELSLRGLLEDIGRARSRAVRHGLYSLIATIFAALTWIGASDPSWTVKLLTLGLAYMSWDSFHSLPTLDEEPEILKPALNEVLRRRVESVNWKRLIHKLSLILGYKQIPEIVVFRMDSADSAGDRPALYH
ncbi:MAG: hypothetical protein ACE5LB_09440 [Acidiferrobacterales bacterium]